MKTLEESDFCGSLEEWKNKINELISKHGPNAKMYPDAGYNNVSLIVYKNDEDIENAIFNFTPENYTSISNQDLFEKIKNCAKENDMTIDEDKYYELRKNLKRKGMILLANNVKGGGIRRNKFYE